MPETLIVGGLTYDIGEFTIFTHLKGTLRGRKQYRLKTKGWWGPLLGYPKVRWLFTVKYESSDSPMHWEATVTATIAQGAKPKKYNDYMEKLAALAIEEFIDRYGVEWKVELKNYETLETVRHFEKIIDVEIVDMRKSNRRAPLLLTFDWTEKEAQKIGA